MRKIVLRKVEIGTPPDEIIIIPWGEVESASGDFVFDQAAAESVLRHFEANRTKLVIDYEHQAVGREYQSPDGTAPAAGWITELRAVPGVGLKGTVEWTDRASKHLASKEYLYLSPVVLINEKDRRVYALHSVGLTNVPAIRGAPALVNKGDDAHANRDELVAVVEAASEARESDDDAAVVAALEEALRAIRKLLEPLEAGNLGTDEAVSRIRSIIVAAIGEPREETAAHKEVVRLRRELEDRDYQSLVQANSAKLPPAMRDWFKELYQTNRKLAEQFVNNARPLVATRATALSARPVSAAAYGRANNIRLAAVEYKRRADEGVMVCSQRAFVNQILREKGLPVLTEDEVRQHSIADRK